MRLLYGASFAQTYGTEPNAVWLEGIAELSNAQCREGFRRLRNEPRRWPPNLTEFMAACRPRKGQSTLGPSTTPQALLAALPPKPNPGLATSWIERIRRKVAAP